MQVVAWDTWAFVEHALGYRRKPEVQQAWQESDVVVTAREIVSETFGFITGRAKTNVGAREWLARALRSRIRIVDPPMDAVVNYLSEHPGASKGSWADFALAFVAEQAGARKIATEDEGFKQLGFEILF